MLQASSFPVYLHMSVWFTSFVTMTKLMSRSWLFNFLLCKVVTHGIPFASRFHECRTFYKVHINTFSGTYFSWNFENVEDIIMCVVFWCVRFRITRNPWWNVSLLLIITNKRLHCHKMHCLWLKNNVLVFIRQVSSLSPHR